MVQKEVRKKTKIYGTAAVLLAIVLISMVYAFGVSPTILPFNQPISVSGMKTFSSMVELKNYLNITTFNSLPETYWACPAHIFTTTPTAVPTATNGIYGVTNDYSTTNIQVAGVDEADTVKTDGQYI